MGFLQDAVIFLAAAVVAVPLFKRLGLGSVLGYLCAGMAIGPWGLGFFWEVEGVLHFAELGVVMLLFLIGLELQPARLWELRRAVFGLGGAQVLGTGVVLGAIALGLGLPPAAALVAGFGLAMSSTAFALQLLAEKNQLTSEHGRGAFGILLFQDLAVIPLLALLPFLAPAGTEAAGGDPMWLSALKVVAVLVGVVLGGRYLLRPVFRAVAATHSQEVFTAAALLVVVGTAALVSLVGLSMALGAFLAGVLLADSEYRHELEADIQPFKGLLLGLFFIAVGMSVTLGLVWAKPLQVLGLVLALVVVKALVLYGVGRVGLGNDEAAVSLAVVISQGGEFAFVLFGIGVDQRIMEPALADLLVVVVSLSMAVTPFLSMIHERWWRPRLRGAAQARREFDVAAESDHPVIIAGFGRVGQVVGRVLRAKRIGFTAMDVSSEHIDFIKRFGNKVFYGDASRIDLLRAARAEEAKVFVLAIDDVEASLRTAETVRTHFPHLTIFARARNRQHAYQLLDMGVTHVTRETFAGSVELTREILQELGLPYSQADDTVTRFRDHDEQLLLSTYQHRKDVGKLTEIAARARQELEQLFEKDQQSPP